MLLSQKVSLTDAMFTRPFLFKSWSLLVLPWHLSLHCSWTSVQWKASLNVDRYEERMTILVLERVWRSKRWVKYRGEKGKWGSIWVRCLYLINEYKYPLSQWLSTGVILQRGIWKGLEILWVETAQREERLACSE